MFYCTPKFFFAFLVVNKCPAYYCCCHFHNSSYFFQKYLNKIFHKVNCIRSLMVSLWLFLENLSWKPPPSFWLSGLPSKPAAQPLSFEFFIFYWIEFPIHWVSCSCLFLFILISENTTWIFFRQKDDAMTEVWPWQLSVCLASDSLWSYPDQLPSSGALCSHRAFPSPSSCDFRAYSSSVLVYFPILMRYIIQYIPDNKCKESKIYWDLTCWKWLFFSILMLLDSSAWYRI